VKTERYAVVTGGGTGGHVSPALAVGEALVAAGIARSEIEFVGGRRGIEGRLVPEAGFDLVRLPGRGIQRRLTAENVSAALGLMASALIATGLALRARPRVVITVGGYAGFGYAFAAVMLRIPLVVITVDAVPGAVNRLVGRYAAANAVAYEGTALPRSTVTGAPVRPAVLAVGTDPASRSATRSRLGVSPDRRLVVVTGGSLGAGSINDAALGLTELWSDRGDMTIYHLAGERNLESVAAEAQRRRLLDSPPDGLDYRLAGFDPDLVAAIGACDVVVCRAGASTVAELTAIGAPSVLVPLPGAPDDHQTKNARALERAGAAVLVPDDLLTAARLASVLDTCFTEAGKLAAMSAAAKSLGHLDAAEQIAAIAQAVASTKARRSR
jgi:UDP-N-acetylglucosamine--N-acetylmuramyl-(pentapeptide) pyrophosphoryl-undecaprenol N-acetylglucosamine transferase